jgi:hypothetical protein
VFFVSLRGWCAHGLPQFALCPQPIVEIMSVFAAALAEYVVGATRERMRSPISEPVRSSIMPTVRIG